ncbi:MULTISPECIES: AAA family ATPase [Nocardia]|uniref:AAA family ATPase n=1 Tax=Nocardia TaxID=1817 RepID=UPI0002ECE3C5|nr:MULTISPECIES: AAA family ATPase [Nocardia]
MRDREWLFAQYVIGQRTLADIAAELGTSYVSMLRVAKRHRIPIRQRAGGQQIPVLAPAAAAVTPRILQVDYNRRRRGWHANLGRLRTPQLAELHEQLWDIVDSNAQDGDKAKGAVGIDAFPGLGKTTSVLAFAKELHRREITEGGDRTTSGHQRWPACRVGLTGNTGMREFNRAMLKFFAHPCTERGSAAQFAGRALDRVLSCETRLLVADDLHFLRMNATSGWRSATTSNTSPTSSR